MGIDRLLAPVLRAGVRAASRLTMLPGRGTLRVAGLQAPATVHFDDYKVPHIEAESDADAFRAHGVCHALDRFFQMDLLRRALCGRISETVGERPLGTMASPPFGRDRTTLDADRLMRVLGLRRVAETVWAGADPEGRALLAAYVEGVNSVVRLLARKKPLEHRALRIGVEPWTPIDSILIAKGMALGLSFTWRTTPVLAAMADRLVGRPEHLAAVLPKTPGEDALTVMRWFDDRLSGVMGFAPIDAPPVGSNAWVVGAGRTRSGLPLLANDPHLELQLPSVWYLTSLRGSRYHAVGASLAGLPGIVMGRNPTLAWGLTNGMIDDGDFWLETLDDAERRYNVDGRWRALGTHSETIKRKGRSPVVMQVRRTHRGPLIGDAFPGYEGPPLSLRLTLFEKDADLHAFVGLGRARTTTEALAEARHFGSPVQNLLVADADGHAGYRLMGKVPARSPDVHPVLPLEGRDSDTDWKGFLPPDELPHGDVGPDDVLVSANHAHAAESYPHYLSHLYEPRYRAQRIHELLDGKHDLTADDMSAVQRDARNRCAPVFRRVVVEPHAEAVRKMRPSVAPLLDRLLSWDGDERVDARGGAVWHLVYVNLVRRTFEPILGREIVDRWMGIINLVDQPLLDAFTNDDNPWAPPNVRATLLCAALDDATEQLARRGLTPDSPWGDFHTLTLAHPAATGPALAAAFNDGPFPMPGGPFTVSCGQHLHSRPGRMRVGPSYRQVVDLGAPDEARMITFGGQSGYVGSRHYADLTPLWRDGTSLPMRLAPPARPRDVLRLTP